MEDEYIESFNVIHRNELLNGEIFGVILGTKVIIENWRKHYNKLRQYSSPCYRSYTSKAILNIRIANAEGLRLTYALVQL
jgi:hypothetical protein